MNVIILMVEESVEYLVVNSTGTSNIHSESGSLKQCCPWAVSTMGNATVLLYYLPVVLIVYEQRGIIRVLVV